MIDNFPAFAKIVAASFQAVTNSQNVFTVDVDGDALFEKYLTSFPEGTNPIFKERTEHDCSCCKQFIRHVGMVVSVGPSGKKLRTVWDEAAKNAPHPYNKVAQELKEMVSNAAIRDIFRVSKKEGSFGAEKTLSQNEETKKVSSWNHFYTGPIPKNFQVDSPGQVCGDYKTTVQVYIRGVSELLPESVATVIAIAQDNTLYRGAEHLPSLLEFQKAQREYLKLEPREAHLFVWSNAHGPASRFRNTVIGTLVQDLSEGVDIEKAVGMFESKVAPQNYKRTTAIITPMMISKAMETVRSLDLEPALERRFAKIDDIGINDVLWVDSGVKPLMKSGLEGMLLKHSNVAQKSTEGDEKRAEDIPMERFVREILPNTTSMELLFKGEHLGNLMSLTAPVHSEPKQLFKWTNDFAWSYTGNVADSYLRKQVQALGGRVDGVLRFSHMWNHEKRNASLMDLHVFLPGSSEHRDGSHDTYPRGQRVGWNHRQDIPSGGVQDVDYVNPAPEGYVPVENITFPKMNLLKDGLYTFKIHNWLHRPPTQGGFKAEIEFGGKVFQYDHPAPLANKEWITLAVVTLKDGVFTIEHRHPVGASGQEQWGLTTEKYVKVNAVTLSPNYWGGNAVGNKHTFFVLDGAKNDEPTRGIYNEFLNSRLEQHRKVFEVIGDKTKCQPTDGQLSGLGFSSTKQAAVLIKVMQGKKQRIFNVQVGTPTTTNTGVTNEHQQHV